MMRLLTLLLLCLALPLAVSAKPLVADISSHDVTIHSSFNGADLIIFGARNDPGDIVIVVRGPEKRAIIRKKEKVNGIWVNNTKEKFTDVPTFYAVASSRPLEEIKHSIYFDALGINDSSILEDPLHPRRAYLAPQRHQEFSRALLRYFRSAGLYNTQTESVDFIGETLFKTRFHMPDNTPRGHYTAEVFLFSDGQLVGMHSTPLRVYKSGFDAFVFDTAHQYPYFYGFICILLALFFGWAASKLFQRF